MKSLVTGSIGLLLLLLASGGFLSGASHKTERVMLSGSSGNYLVGKPDLRRGHFEVDYGRTTTFSITSTADVDLYLQIDAPTVFGFCPIEFSIDMQGIRACQSKIVKIAPNAAAVTLTATGGNVPPYIDVLDMPTYPSDVLIGPTIEALVARDPELEIEREMRNISIVAMLASLFFFWWSWRSWRRS
jgi:hypothetical protein